MSKVVSVLFSKLIILGGLFSCCKSPPEEEDEYVPRNELVNEDALRNQNNNPKHLGNDEFNSVIKIQINSETVSEIPIINRGSMNVNGNTEIT